MSGFVRSVWEARPVRPSELTLLEGHEAFSVGDFTVLDFWRWALGDLRMNNTRGYLAEFLVARAVGARSSQRVEWGAHDVLAPDGTRIEVKSSAYLQSWAQRAPSIPRFSLTGAKSVWDPAVGAYVEDPTGRVEIWVFALHTCTEHARYDPLDVGQWCFWILPAKTVETCGQKMAAISTIRRLAGEPCPWEGLSETVAQAARRL